MTDEIPQAAKDYAKQLSLESGNAEAALARLAHENGLVPKGPEPIDPIHELARHVSYAPTTSRAKQEIQAWLAKHNHAIVKVATDEERLIEARELCSMVAEEWGGPGGNYRKGNYDHDHEMIAMLAALKARDGAA